MFDIIVAIDNDNGIGKNGIIPWSKPNDMANFKRITTTVLDYNKSNAVIMGRLTWESLPSKHLPNRINIIISSTLNQTEYDEITIFQTLNDAIEYTKNNIMIEKVFIIGGERIYQEALLHYDLRYIYVTNILENYNCDKFFPKIDPSRFKLESSDNIKELVFNKYINIYNSERENKEEIEYLNLLKSILDNGVEKNTRNGMTKSLFVNRLSFDMNNGFPLLTTKKCFWRGIVEELLFFINGKTNANILKTKNIKIWNENTSKEFIETRNLDYKEGDMGPMYGFQWRHYGSEYYGMDHNYNGMGFDQLKNCINNIKENPNDRRHIITTFNPNDVSKSVLAPCHGICTQFYVDNNKLSCAMVQRSADCFLGLPFNIASYALLLHLIAKECDLEPFKLEMILMDTHIYEEHFDVVKEQIKRKPFIFPKLMFTKKKILNNEYKYEDFELHNYICHDKLSGKMKA